MFSQMAAVVEGLLANGAAVASRCFVLLVGVFSDVMVLEVLPSVKASVAHSTQKAARLAMNGLSVPLQRFLASEALGAKVADGPLAVALGRSGKSTLASAETRSKSRRTSTVGRCTFLCLARWSFR